MHDGRLVTLEHESRILADNPLGDPAVRRFPVWLPPQYERPRRRFPVLFMLAPYTGSGWSLTDWRNFDESIPERLGRLVAERRLGPVVVAFPIATPASAATSTSTRAPSVVTPTT